ncbi:unnamed protein product, partial [Pylaiella littoralis]
DEPSAQPKRPRALAFEDGGLGSSNGERMATAGDSSERGMEGGELDGVRMGNFLQMATVGDSSERGTEGGEHEDVRMGNSLQMVR